jgi:major membrane immunogen (membrane-anchored lipoprotein)
MKKAIVISMIIGSMLLIGCGNAATRQFGGTTKVELPKGKKLVTITWKDNDLWYLTKDMKDTDIAESYEFQEKSNLGLVEGLVKIKEVK